MASNLTNQNGVDAALGNAPAEFLVRRTNLTRNNRALVAALLILAVAANGQAHGAPAEPAGDRYADAPTSGNPFRAAVSEAAPVASAENPADQPARRARADAAMLEARRALSVGDVPRAQQLLEQVEQLRVVYQGPGDSPQAVAESIREYKDLNDLRAAEGGVAAWRQGYARFLVKQADALLAWNDLDTATRAANEAAQLGPQLGPGSMTPQDVLRRIKLKRENLAGAPADDGKAPAGIDPKGATLELLAQARAALAKGDLAAAEAIGGKASALNVPDSEFDPEQDRPSRLAADLQRARAESQSVELAASGLQRTATPDADDYSSAALDFDPSVAAERVAQLPNISPLPLPGADDRPAGADGASEARAMLEAGEQALRAGDRSGALESFRAAYESRAQLDLLSQQRLQGHLQMLQAPAGESLPSPNGELLDAASVGESVVARQLSADVSKRQAEAKKIRESDPRRSLTLLEEARDMVQKAELADGLKTQLVARLDWSIGETEKYIAAHKSELDLKATNDRITGEIDRERVVKVEVQGRIAQSVEEFNKLIDEQRYAEAEVVANRLYEMAPDELVAQQINKQAKMIRRQRWSQDIIAQSEDGVANSFLDVRDTAAQALADSTKIIGYGQDWPEKVANRKTSGEVAGGLRGPKEIEIEQKLRTPVLPRYDETPLTKVVEGLSQLAGVNIHLDPRGLSQEGVRSDTPITLNLPQEISLKSALTLILEPLHLTYTIKDEVLKITSEQIRDGDVIIRTYAVGDLVIPIPNFVPNNNIGLQGLINDAYAAMGAYSGGAPGAMAVVAGNRPGQAAGAVPNTAMAQQFGAPPSAGSGSPLGGGPGGLGGAASADFDSLIDLIISTVEHDSWMENGTGEGEIQPFPTNLSLVISQTQRVHEQIADLLEQLRRLQDLQVTIEVRFIRLTDSFFERIGIDFDFNIEDRSGLPPGTLVPGRSPEGLGASATVGINPPLGVGDFPNYTVDLDLPFRQESFGLSEPQFGVPTDVATFGFSILSDIEAFFLIEASQGDRRANVLQAPKVTLFNGQQAVVIDAAFRPFVISVIPVVGEFAAAQQPVIVVLSEGTMLTVQAVVSDDRRYVRLTLVPFFSQIGQVQEFTFEGSETTSTSNNSTDDDDDGNDETNEDAEEITRSGTTVQLPTFEVISVSTTVSVPDGGTVLLGGIKRLVEGRNEFGVPLLSKVPYIDRLFRNVGIGRETDSLMMMVTPHIIIQEEEEDRLGTAP